MSDLKQRILDYVRATDYVSFAELGNRFGDEFFGGDAAICAGHENIVLWSGMTDDGRDAVKALLVEAKILAVPTEMLVYLVDGRTMAFPLVKSRRKYKKPHWLPVTLRPAEKLH